MLDRIVEDVSKFENLSYLHVSFYEYFNVTMKKSMKMISKQKTSTTKESVNVMIAVPLGAEKLCSDSSEKGRSLLCTDGTKLILDRARNSRCTLIACTLTGHTASDGRAALSNYITETNRETLQVNHAARMPAQIIWNVVKSGFIPSC